MFFVPLTFTVYTNLPAEMPILYIVDIHKYFHLIIEAFMGMAVSEGN